MKIGLIDYDGKMPNLALMKLSAFHKAAGNEVVLNPTHPNQVDKVYASVLFTWHKRKAAQLTSLFKDVEFGGTGWDVNAKLAPEIEAMKPDFDLYTIDALLPRLKGIRDQEKRTLKAQTLIDAGLGFSTRGCVRQCKFCLVPKKEGKLHKVGEIADLLNPRSNNLLLLDNNLTADPDCIPKLNEMRDRKLRVSITQGIDVRLVTPEIAHALSEVKLMGKQLHYAWDLPNAEGIIMNGIKTLSNFIGYSKQMCYMLVGFDTTWEEDMYRFRRLTELKIDPYVMLYNKDEGTADARLRHFARWCNARIYKACPDFEQYTNWAKIREAYYGASQPMLLAA